MSSIHVVSYNVLSSHLGEADYFTSCDPEFLKETKRMEKLQKILQEHTNKRAIICLQEVSTRWAGILHTFFSQRGYYMITGMYGKKFNGYMGVSIAIPLDRYKIIDVDITTVSDTKKKAPKAPKIQISHMMATVYYIYDAMIKLTKTTNRFILYMFGLYSEIQDAWSLALWRTNQIVSVRLQPVDTTSENLPQSFVVGNYHMPCMFEKPQVMMIHTALSVQHLQNRSGSDPLIYCGDFNSKPKSPMYNLITKAIIDPKDVSTPMKYFEGDTWSVNSATTMASAYHLYHGKEPEFTNFSKVKEEPEFTDTLDYIFLSSHWKVLNVIPLPSKSQIIAETSGKPLPHENYPSDHLLIGSELSV